MNFVKSVGLALIGTALAIGGAAAQQKTIKIATEGAYAPWNFTGAGGKLDGYDVELANELCNRIKIKCEVIAQDWDGIIPALQAKKYDAIMAGMSITDERKKVIEFSTSYANSPNGLLVAKNSPLAKIPGTGQAFNLTTQQAAAEKAINDLKPLLKGKTIGVQGSTIHSAFADKYLKGTAEIREYKTTEQHDLDLAVHQRDHRPPPPLTGQFGELPHVTGRGVHRGAHDRDQVRGGLGHCRIEDSAGLTCVKYAESVAAQAGRLPVVEVCVQPGVVLFPRAPRHTRRDLAVGAAVGGERVQVGAGGGVVGVAGRANYRGRRGEQHERGQGFVAGQLVQVPGARDLRCEYSSQAGLVLGGDQAAVGDSGQVPYRGQRVCGVDGGERGRYLTPVSYVGGDQLHGPSAGRSQ